MAGVKALRKIQLGREVTPGTAVVATTLWRGLGTIKDARTIEMVDEDIGLLINTNRSYIPKYMAEISMESVPATFQQLLHLFEAGIMTASPVADGAGTGFIYTYNVPTTSIPTIQTYTIEGGDNQQAEEMEYSFVSEFTLEGAGGEALMMSGNWTGRQVTNTTFTGAIAIPVVEEILTSRGKIYIDTVASGFGNTQVSNLLLKMSLKVKTGLIAKFTTEGELYFSFHQSTRPEIELNLTFEHTTDAVNEKIFWRDQTPRAIRIIFEGSGLTTPGAFDFHTLILDLPGIYKEFANLGDQDGNDIYDVTFSVGYDPTIGHGGQIVVVNQLSAVP